MDPKIHYFVIGKTIAKDFLHTRHSFNAKYFGRDTIKVGDEIIFSKVAEDELPYAIEKKYFKLAEDEKLTNILSKKIFKVINISDFYGTNIRTITVRRVRSIVI